MIILHIVPAELWKAALPTGSYRSSTFDQDGFIHLSRPDQVLRVAQERFSERRDLLLLCIDPQRVKAPIWYENLDGGSSLFPHIYGPLNVDAVLAAPELLPDGDGIFHLPPEVEAWQFQIRPAAPEQAIEILKEYSGGILADIATGGGNFLDALVQTFKDVHLPLGVDSNPAPARNPAGMFAQGKADFIHMDALKLGFAGNSLDTGAIANSLHHLEQPLLALHELKRAIRPGGRCVIQEMYRDGLNLPQQSHMLLHHWWAEVDRGRGIHHDPTFTRAEIIDLVEQTGWRRVKFMDIADLSGDPLDPELIAELEKIIDRYQGFAANQPQAEMLQAKGEELRARIREFGFQNASGLLVLAEK